MVSDPGEYAPLFAQLSAAVQDFLQAVEQQDPTSLATDEWTVRQMLAHIAFWHAYYAQNYAALADGRQPFVFTSKGGSTRNQKGVDSLGEKTQPELVRMIQDAHASLYESIVVCQVPGMSYTDRRSYQTADFLKAISGHIQRHTLHVRHAKKIKS